MSRWEPNARLRLVRAAIDLFAEQGYDNTTVTQIAERAGLTRTTFFRHFPDKREVLFAGQDTHSRLRLQSVIAANGELQERNVFKRAGLAAAMTEALRERGVPDPAASLAAELGVLAFHRAYVRWTEPANRQGYPELARQALDELRAVTATLR
jgi:AcrR family transcriptional regulator